MAMKGYVVVNLTAMFVYLNWKFYTLSSQVKFNSFLLKKAIISNESDISFVKYGVFMDVKQILSKCGGSMFLIKEYWRYYSEYHHIYGMSELGVSSSVNAFCLLVSLKFVPIKYPFNHC